jgi:hypothetical protein
MKFDKEKLIDLVLAQIAVDVENDDVTAIEEMIKFLPEERLVSYLPEELFEEMED